MNERTLFTPSSRRGSSSGSGRLKWEAEESRIKLMSSTNWQKQETFQKHNWRKENSLSWEEKPFVCSQEKVGNKNWESWQNIRLSPLGWGVLRLYKRESIYNPELRRWYSYSVTWRAEVKILSVNLLNAEPIISFCNLFNWIEHMAHLEKALFRELLLKIYLCLMYLELYLQ